MVDRRPAKKHNICPFSKLPAVDNCASPAHSITDSNDYEACRRHYNSKMTEAFKEAADWNDSLQQQFAETLVSWRTAGTWHPTQRGKTNWYKISLHVNGLCSVNLSWEQYQSKYYRWKDSWAAFKSLRGISRNAETGIGWDEERLCFTAGPDQWVALCLENKKFKQFRGGKSCAIFLVLDEIFQNSTATGSRAVGSKYTGFLTEDDVQLRPTSGQPESLPTADANIVEPTDPSLASFGGQETVTPTIGRSKRPTSSRDNVAAGGSCRGSKSSKSQDTLQEALSNFSRLSSMRLQQRDSRTHPDNDPYGMEQFVEYFDSRHTLPHHVREACMNVFLSSRDARVLFMKSGPEYQLYWINKQAEK